MEASNKLKQLQTKVPYPPEVIMGEVKVQLPAGLASAHLADPKANQEEPKEPSTFASLFGILLCSTSELLVWASFSMGSHHR